jgi:UDP-N-acetylmuramate--alanine ligase
MMNKVHFIGIGGTGLSAIAKVLLERGYIISGSDSSYSNNIEILQNAGAQIFLNHDPANLKNPDVVIRSSAVPDENVEVRAALQRRIPVVKRADFLPELIGNKKCIAVSGTHGKTTTTSMIAWILVSLGLDPSYILGSKSVNLGNNAQEGKGEYFVIEADEYDNMFLGLQPDIAVVTSIEHDHPDFFPTYDEFFQAFRDFSNQVKKNGTMLICGNEKGSVKLVHDDSGPERKIVYEVRDEIIFGNESKVSNGIRFQAASLSVNNSGFYEFIFKDKENETHMHVSLQIPGIHNVMNACCALGVSRLIGLPLREAVKAIEVFTGTSRRFEVRGQKNEVTFIDDYAHHPTEIKATLLATRDRFPEGRIWAVWQPHTFTRTRKLLAEFSTAFINADCVIVLEVYPAREQVPENGFSSKNVLQEMTDSNVINQKTVLYAQDIESAINQLKNQTRPGDVVVVLSAGDANLIIEKILNFTKSAENHLHRNQLGQVFGDRYKRNIKLEKFTASRIGGSADVLIEIYSIDDLSQAAIYFWNRGIPFRVLGGGSNVLVSDDGYRGAILLNKAKQFIFNEELDPPTIWVESGASIGVISRKAARKGLSGLEWAVGIPGTIGGAVFGNAGAYGGDVSGALQMAEILHLKINNNHKQTSREIWTADCFDFSYRSSSLKKNPGKYIVLACVLGLNHSDPISVQKQADRFADYRRKTQPPGASMGSMFKNPYGEYAGRLIDSAGLKGTRIGGAEISRMHANFFVNLGDATAEDVLALIELAKSRVAEKFGIELELEIELLGNFNQTGLNKQAA